MKKEFSKIILGAVMILYFAGAIFAAVIVVNEHYGLEALLTYLGAPTATAIGFYAWKARAENVVKISKSVSTDKKLDKSDKQQIISGIANVLNDAFNNNDIEG